MWTFKVRDDASLNFQKHISEHVIFDRKEM